jgi:hypothetical protein
MQAVSGNASRVRQCKLCQRPAGVTQLLASLSFGPLLATLNSPQAALFETGDSHEFLDCTIVKGEDLGDGKLSDDRAGKVYSFGKYTGRVVSDHAVSQGVTMVAREAHADSKWLA